MVWNQRGKKGVHSGRTLRRNVGPQYGSRGLDRKGLITKYQRNAGGFAQSLKESLLEDRYGVVDGLTLAMTPPRNAFFRTDIEFSLGKRKRWRIPELIQEKVSLDSEETFEEEEEEKEEEDNEDNLNVCFVERHIHPEMSSSKGDCISYFSDKDGKFLIPKHKYSYQTDLRLDKDEKLPEICYEICRPTPPTSWPNMKEGAFIRENYDKLYQVKKRGQKSKRLCWGNYGIKDLSFKDSKEFLSDMSKPRRTNPIESKVKTVANKEFSKVVKEMELSNSGEPSLKFQFPMGQYIDTLLKKGNKESAERMKCQSGKPLCPVKIGKRCAVFIDPEPSTKWAEKVESCVYPDSSPITLEDSKHQVEVDIDLQDLSTSALKSEWKDLYHEGGVSPRKFTFDISNLLPNTNLGFGCVILFEVDENVPKAKTSAKSVVSLVPVTLCSGMSDYTKETENFISNIAEANKCVSAPLRIKDIVNAAIDVYSTNPGHGKGPMKKTDKNSTTLRSLGFLNELCGWKSESFSLECAKQQLKDDYHNEVRGQSNKVMLLDSNWMMPSFDCGICFEHFEGDSMLTSLKECGHAFCNDCWKGHLKIQINQGIQCIKCPGQSCDSQVDDIIIMSVIPLWYQKFLNMKLNKKLETSPNWKWCPGTGCQKVVKATAHGLEELTALCDCGMAWCFKCKQPSHWPATCVESKTFDKIGKDHKEALMEENKELITSVMVKNCPHCSYPIEKYFGCQFMSCVLCGTSFCWNCCTPATYSHQCDKDETHNLDKVELSFRRKKFQFEKFLKVVVKSIQARVPKKLSAKSTKAKALETGAKNYKAISSTIDKEVFSKSDISRVMEYVVEHGLPQTFQEAVEFEFQAHLVLEGFAKKAAVSKTKHRSGMHAMSQLGFVVDRIDNLCQEPFSLCKDGKLQKLKQLLTLGKDCILTLKKFYK